LVFLNYMCITFFNKNSIDGWKIYCWKFDSVYYDESNGQNAAKCEYQ